MVCAPLKVSIFEWISIVSQSLIHMQSVNKYSDNIFSLVNIALHSCKFGPYYMV